MGRPDATAIRPAAATPRRSSVSRAFAAASAVSNAAGSSETAGFVSSRFFPSSEDGKSVVGFAVTSAVASGRRLCAFPGLSPPSPSPRSSASLFSRDFEKVGTAAASDSAPDAARRDRSGFERIATPAGTVISSSSSPFARFSCHGFVVLRCVSRSERGRFVFAHVTSGRFFSSGFTRHRSQSSRTVSDGYTCVGRRRRGAGVSRGKGEGDVCARAGFRGDSKKIHTAPLGPGGGGRARTSTTSALATVSSWDSLDRRSPRRSDRSPPCSFRFSARCARGRWGRGRERTRQCDPFEGTRGCGCLRKCVGTHHALSLGVRAVRFDRPRIRPLGGFPRRACGWMQMRVAGDDRWDAPGA